MHNFSLSRLTTTLCCTCQHLTLYIHASLANLLFTICSLLFICSFLFALYCWLFTVCSLLFALYCLLFTICSLLFALYYLFFTICSLTVDFLNHKAEPNGAVAVGRLGPSLDGRNSNLLKQESRFLKT